MQIKRIGIQSTDQQSIKDKKPYATNQNDFAKGNGQVQQKASVAPMTIKDGQETDSAADRNQEYLNF